jgi:hypothetical protein
VTVGIICYTVLVKNKLLITSLVLSSLIIALSFSYYLVFYLPHRDQLNREVYLSQKPTPIPSPILSPVPVTTLSPSSKPSSTCNPEILGKALRDAYPNSYPGLSDEIIGTLFIEKYLSKSCL